MPDISLQRAGDPADCRDRFFAAVDEQITAFEGAALVQRVASGTVTMAHYHAILTTLFHQTRSSPYTFAKAAANCSWRHEEAKEYLLRHAEEEGSHWRWILDDLRRTGYGGPDPRSGFPHVTCEAYVSFNHRVAEEMPVARLAIAHVLEGIGAAFGSSHGRLLLGRLGLGKEHATFFLSHGETDRTHVAELRELIGRCALEPSEWADMAHAAEVAGTLYRAMYSHQAFV